MSIKYKTVIADGITPLVTISRCEMINLDAIINFNTQVITKEESETLAGIQTKKYLKSTLKSGAPIEKGIIIRLPLGNTGGLSNQEERSLGSYIFEQQDNIDWSPSHKTYEIGGFYLRRPEIGSHDLSLSGKFYVLASGNQRVVYDLPVLPQEFSERNNVSFYPVQLLGRSVAHQVYNYSGRSCSVNFTLHEELVSDYNYIHELVSAMNSACYPEYNAKGVVSPPEVILEIGSQFRIRGVISGDVSANWEPPFIDGRYVNCKVSLGITETLGPYSMSEIRKMEGWRK